MEPPFGIVPDHLCRACFKKFNTTTAAEESARVDILEMPGLMIKLSACISSIFITTNRVSKYLCLDCFERVNEFYEFREMCLQSIRRFQETKMYKEEPIESEGTNDILLSIESAVKKEYEYHHVNALPQIFGGPLENQEPRSNKESIETEGMNDHLFSSESVVKEEYESHEQALASNRATNSIQKLNQKNTACNERLNTQRKIDTKIETNSNKRKLTAQALEHDLHSFAESVPVLIAKNEPVTECSISLTSSNENTDSKHRTNLAYKHSRSNAGNLVHMSLDGLDSCVSVKNELICSEGEKDLSSDDFRSSTLSSNVPKNSQEDVHDKHILEIGSKVEESIRIVSKTTQKAAVNRIEKRKTYRCGKCRKRFKKEVEFIAHTQTHDGLKRYQCTYDGCDKSFVTLEYRQKHHKRHEKLKSERKLYHCTYDGCDKSFETSEYRQKHHKRHEKWKSECELFHCTYEGCDKLFSTPKEFRRHQITRKHGLKRYHCTHEGCVKSYARLEYLQKHQSRHETPNSELKSYHCTHKGCDKIFSWSSGLNRHLKRHKILNGEHGPERFHCTHEGCDKSFAWLVSLKNHQIRHEDPNNEHGTKG